MRLSWVFIGFGVFAALLSVLFISVGMAAGIPFTHIGMWGLPLMSLACFLGAPRLNRYYI